MHVLPFPQSAILGRYKNNEPLAAAEGTIRGESGADVMEMGRRIGHKSPRNIFGRVSV
jgi:hypothetical protein